MLTFFSASFALTLSIPFTEKRKNRKGASSTSKSNSRPIVQSTVNVVNGPIISTTKDKENKTKTIEDG